MLSERSKNAESSIFTFRVHACCQGAEHRFQGVAYAAGHPASILHCQVLGKIDKL